MKNSILIVGFLKQFNREICVKLSDDLNMFYADVSDLIAYELSNGDEMITICGQEYYDKQEIKTIKHISNFDNTIININFDNFYNHDNYKNFKNNCVIIYCKIGLEELNKAIKDNNDIDTWPTAIDVIDFDERDKFLMENCDYVVENNKLNLAAYVKSIKEILNNVSRG